MILPIVPFGSDVLRRECVNIDKWIVDNINDTYIQINENFSSCSCYNKWIK